MWAAETPYLSWEYWTVTISAVRMYSKDEVIGCYGLICEAVAPDLAYSPTFAYL